MGLDRPIDVTADQRKTLLALLERYLPNTETWVYGSRVKWTSRPQSDLDLVVFATPEQEGQVSDLREAFEESNLPFRVDLFVWDAVPEKFRKHIKCDHVMLVAKEKPVVGSDAGEAGEWIYAIVHDIAASSRNALVGGPFGSNLVSRDYVSEGVPVIRGQNMGARWVTGHFVFVTPQKAESLEANLARPGDIVLTQRGTLGQVSIVPSTPFGRYVVSQSQMKVTGNREIADPMFFYYVLSSAGQKDYVRLNTIQGHESRTSISASFGQTHVPDPPLNEQRAIAHILGTLDDKIELNRRMNETLEVMARTLFKSWFVDFDPVRAKMEGRDPNLPQHLADLFPDRLVDSELGEIPEGWEVIPLDEIAVFQNGLALQKYRPQVNEKRLPVVKIAQLRSGKTDSGEWATSNIRPECIIDDGEVVFSWSGSLMVTVWCSGRAALNQHLFKVTSRRFPKWFLLHNVRSHLADFQTIAAGKATTMGHIKRHHLSEAKCTVPDRRLLAAADRRLAAMFDRSVSANIQSRTLAALRDALLPKLISGEIRIRHAQIQQLVDRT